MRVAPGVVVAIDRSVVGWTREERGERSRERERGSEKEREILGKGKMELTKERERERWREGCRRRSRGMEGE